MRESITRHAVPAGTTRDPQRSDQGPRAVTVAEHGTSCSKTISSNLNIKPQRGQSAAINGVVGHARSDHVEPITGSPRRGFAGWPWRAPSLQQRRQHCTNVGAGGTYATAPTNPTQAANAKPAAGTTTSPIAISVTTKSNY
ncbi:hypothetical protein A8144_00005 [Mycobacterium leprae 3125609]|uniref:Uncharacterized protein n=1 Tax=Mycobacterium leprae TaxID=1769 RepID=O33136_MYCLR|nr:hypothetical protein A8144_00005 [Mycobacterium leprae 3125609]OAX72192.1 hypothetical protein A3216_00060 [Mycobacterium leprae 7935681]CAB16156.1 hypothetical protein MLCL536.13 [Mycobacterium leprae]